MFLAVLLIYIGCLVVFLSSKQQQVKIKRLSKKLSWSIFFVAMIAGITIFSQKQLVVVACLLTLTNVMAIWIFLVFSQRYFRPTFLKYVIAGILFSIIAYWLGS